ncbi:hypothetical protein ACFPN2_14775 [Steroidobacter flavus]|uniref:Uncharacterized protein n=1 Tax=Steroidobacter flavus TaxID=1842136 RepID=A0ABV8SRY0_9GAMM
MDDWEPISREEFDVLLAKELLTFEAADHELWSRYRVGVRTAPIVRSQEYGAEQVFVVAVIGDRILLFDDVEDEFGVARLPPDKPLEDYGTYGELRFALRALAFSGVATAAASEGV